MKQCAMLFALFCLFISSGCAPEVQSLQAEIKSLKGVITDKQQKNDELTEELSSCNSLSSALGKEKTSKDKNMMALKGKTRSFLKKEFDSFNTFSRNDELMDYMGGELLTRAEANGSDLTIINLKSLPSDSVIYNVKAKFSSPCTFFPQLFRPTSQGTICVWQGKMLQAKIKGHVTLELDTPLNTLKGDYIGFYFPKKVGISYDTRTGNVAIVNDKIDLGEKLPSSYASENRTYSIGINGFLN